MAKFRVGDLIYDTARPTQRGMVFKIGSSVYYVKHRGRVVPQTVGKSTARYMPTWMLVKYFKGRDPGNPSAADINEKTRRIRKGWGKKTFLRRRKMAEQKCKVLGRTLRTTRTKSESEEKGNQTGPPS